MEKRNTNDGEWIDMSCYDQIVVRLYIQTDTQGKKERNSEEEEEVVVVVAPESFIALLSQLVMKSDAVDNL